MRIKEQGYIYDKENKKVTAEVFEGDRAVIPDDKAFFFGTREDAESEGLDFTAFDEYAR